MRIHIIGIGLIGGSFAKGVRQVHPDATILGTDANKGHLKSAKELDLIDGAASLETVSEADLVVVAVPVDASLEVILKVLSFVKESALVMDMGSTKAKLCKALEGHPRRKNFLATHPIAGTEFSGPEAAIEGLFRGKTNIICEVEKTSFALQERALQLFQQLGMRIRYMEPAAHDRHIAYVSHLSHISSFMLGKTVLEKEKDERDIFDMAGSGFASTVRLAKSSPAMWTPIFQENKENVLESLREYIQHLNEFKRLLEMEDFEGVFLEMERTNHIRTVLNGID